MYCLQRLRPQKTEHQLNRKIDSGSLSSTKERNVFPLFPDFGENMRAKHCNIFD